MPVGRRGRARRPCRERRWLRVMLWSLALLALGALTVWAVDVARIGRGLLGNAREVQRLAADPQSLTADEVSALLADLRSNVVAIDRRAGRVVPIAGVLGWVPRVGGTVAQAPVILELADALSELGVLMWQDLSPVLAAYEAADGTPLLDLAPSAVEALLVDRDAKAELARRAADACLELQVTALPKRFAEEADMLCAAAPLAASALDAADALPALLGFDSPSTYLLLALNEDELRPGGGFITSVGELRIAAGRIASMAFRDSYAVDDFSQPYPDPPDPIRHFMGIDLWVFRDSNWSPDFPTSAEQALDLYRPGYRTAADPAAPRGAVGANAERRLIDGVIGIDQTGVQMLIAALGPLDVPGAPGPVTGDTFLDYVYETWAPEDGTFDGQWWVERKSFIPDVASAALARVNAGDFDAVAVARAALAGLETRHLQVYLRDTSAQGFLQSAGWDSAVQEPAGDFLMVVEANLGYNKVSANLDRSLQYVVDLQDVPARARATLSYRHLGPTTEACEPEIAYDPLYTDMMNRCYWAYLRLFVPQGARVLDAPETPVPASALHTDEPWSGLHTVRKVGRHTAIGQGFLLPGGDRQELVYSYELPAQVVRRGEDGAQTYSLLIQKQAGLQELAAEVRLRLPRNAVVFDSHPAEPQDEDGVLLFSIRSDIDIEIKVHYHLAKDGAQ